MKSQKITFVSAVVSAMLLTCSLALAGRIEGPIVRGEVGHALSRPLRDVAPVNAAMAAQGALLPPVTSLLLNYDGQAGTGPLYADAIGAVGPTQYMQLVNNKYTVYDKTTGNVIAGPVVENALWSAFGSSCQTSNDGEGTVNYDQAAGRWILAHHAIPTKGPYLNCVAVSTTSDAAGTYSLYGFQLTLQFPDKPKIGVWSDAYYVSQDILTTSGHNFIRSQACALDRNAMLAGTYAQSICFQGGLSIPTFVVTNLDGPTPPPAGAQAYFWQLDQRPNVGKNTLNQFLMHADFVNPLNSTFTGPLAIALPAYVDNCANFKPCVIQPGTTNLLQGFGDRMMYRIVYRNFGDHESVVMTHAVNIGAPGPLQHSGIRWYEFRTPLTPVIYQYGTFVPDKNYHWVPSIAMDKVGDIAVGYNVSGPTVYPGIRYTGWQPTDPLGKMEPETSIKEGAGSQQATNQNWSSYSSMTIDPVDDCTFWFTGAYYAANSTSGWSTRIASLRFPSCH